jgi:hypothetical protein
MSAYYPEIELAVVVVHLIIAAIAFAILRLFIAARTTRLRLPRPPGSAPLPF